MMVSRLDVDSVCSITDNLDYCINGAPSLILDYFNFARLISDNVYGLYWRTGLKNFRLVN